MATRLNRKIGNFIRPGKEAMKRCRQKKKLQEEAAAIVDRIQLLSLHGDHKALHWIGEKAKRAARLPYRWDEKDLTRSKNILQKIRRELGLKNIRNHTISDLENKLNVIYSENAAPAEEKIAALANLNQQAGNELLLTDPKEIKETDENFHLLLTLKNQPKEYPDWFTDKFIKFVLANFDRNQCIHISNKLYETLVSIQEMEEMLSKISANDDEDDEDTIVF